MLTSDKAICEMNTGELAEEYEYCMKSAESEALAPDLQRYFRDRDAEVANGRGYYDASGKFHYHHVPNDEW